MKVLFIILIFSSTMVQLDRNCYLVIEVDTIEEYDLIRCIENGTNQNTVILFKKELGQDSIINQSLVGCNIDVEKLVNLSVQVKGSDNSHEVAFENNDVWKGGGNVDLYISENNVIHFTPCKN